VVEFAWSSAISIEDLVGQGETLLFLRSGRECFKLKHCDSSCEKRETETWIEGAESWPRGFCCG